MYLHCSCFFALLLLEEKEKVFTTLNAAKEIEFMEQNSSGVFQILTYLVKGNKQVLIFCLF